MHIDSHSATPHLHAYPADEDAAVSGAADSGLTPIGHTVVTSGRRPSKPVNGFCPVIVGVAGASGSGKTSIAELIAARLRGGHVLSISSDNYYKTLPPGTDPAQYNFDHPSSIDFDLLADHLQKLRNGEDVEVPHYDFATHKRTGETTHVEAKATSVIILDGIFVLWADRVAAQCDLTIFCSEDLDVCLVRRLRRDLVERGRTVESVLNQYLRFVKAGFEEFVAPSMAKADLIIPRARENAVAIDMLARDLQRRVDAQFPSTATAAGGAGEAAVGFEAKPAAAAPGSPRSASAGAGEGAAALPVVNAHTT